MNDVASAFIADDIIKKGGAMTSLSNPDK